jgi:hypothetical protein
VQPGREVRRRSSGDPLDQSALGASRQGLPILDGRACEPFFLLESSRSSATLRSPTAFSLVPWRFDERIAGTQRRRERFRDAGRYSVKSRFLDCCGSPHGVQGSGWSTTQFPANQVSRGLRNNPLRSATFAWVGAAAAVSAGGDRREAGEKRRPVSGSRKPFPGRFYPYGRRRVRVSTETGSH